MKVTIASKNESFNADSKLERSATKFSNSAHVILPKEFISRDIVLFILKKVFRIKVKSRKSANVKRK